MKHRSLGALLVISVFSLAAASCGSTARDSSTQAGLAMAALDQMPADVQAAPATVREAYQFAVANPEVLQQLPCYCGCGSMGHTSNYACYVAGTDAAGAIEYDSHALGCSICVDITQDAMRLLQEGKSVPEIRSYVDATYSRYGPSNIP